MPNNKVLIDSLNKNDKVSLVYINQEQFEGYVYSIDENMLTINEYISDIYRTFNRIDIIEIEKNK